jgi:hypothetical protein
MEEFQTAPLLNNVISNATKFGFQLVSLCKLTHWQVF